MRGQSPAPHRSLAAAELKSQREYRRNFNLSGAGMMPRTRCRAKLRVVKLCQELSETSANPQPFVGHSQGRVLRARRFAPP
jgi:hypothetical protein